MCAEEGEELNTDVPVGDIQHHQSIHKVNLCFLTDLLKVLTIQHVFALLSAEPGRGGKILVYPSAIKSESMCSFRATLHEHKC